MKLITYSPKKSLNKAFLKQRPLRSEIDLFKANLKLLLDKTNIIENRPKDETEEHLKNNVRDFLLDTYYKTSNAINTKDKEDLVIHTRNTTESNVGVIIEAKRPSNKGEMISVGKPNTKALQELVLYYLRERVEYKNIDIRNLAITNTNEWYFFDSKEFERLFYNNKNFIKQYEEWHAGQKVTKDTNLFYNNIAKPYIDSIESIQCTYFNLKEYKTLLESNSEADDKKLVALYKILSPNHLLKVPFANDSNKLDEKFYRELLHIVGLEETSADGKIVIKRKLKNRNAGSLLENTIEQIKDELYKVSDVNAFGPNSEEQLFNVSLELCITWINRILFLKLLEGQLVNYHKGDATYKFLKPEIIQDFDELSKLFHKVLAVNIPDRTAAIQAKFKLVPYLNSSLFESTPLEDQTIKISSLDPSISLELLPNTILQSDKKSASLPTLAYLFKFLDAYDFASEGSEDIQEDTKTLINASVLGKVFEKINGYKDGSIFTPGFITMYICRQTIRAAVVEKFNSIKNWKLKNYEALYDKIDDKDEANAIINSLKICDPAVGSGHFLVSALNEIIAIKSELRILKDTKGKRLKEYSIEVVNDELIVSDEDGEIFTYNPSSEESQRVQETLFTEKQTIIENCLFGVDINPKSVLICRLRLWIELLKNAYYKKQNGVTELETLPNIDINIKCGNSLISRFALDADISKALKSIKYDAKAYRGFVNDYKNERSREVKRGLQKIIEAIKNDFRTEILKNDPKVLRLNKAGGELFNLLNQTKLFEADTKEKKAIAIKKKKLEEEIEKLAQTIEEIKNNAVYKNAFEWRFEFPEVLDNDGNFEGFDAIIGNPPYIQLQKLDNSIKVALQQQEYITYAATGDIYQLFYEKGVKLLKSNGHLGYITSNKWMRTDYGSITRGYLSTQCEVQSVIDFGMAQLFESATTYTNIILLSKGIPQDTIKMCRVTKDFDETVRLEDFVDFASVQIKNPGESSWIAYGKKEYDLIQKIISKGKVIKEWDIKINYGLKTGFNDAFIIDTETRNQLVEEDPKSIEIIRPILRGEDIKAYLPAWNNKWIINTHNGVKNKGIMRIDAAKEYPAVYRWLRRFESALIKRQDKGDHWSNLRNCAYLEEFYKPKIIYPNMTKFMPFVYDKHQFFTNDKSFILTGNSLEYLTAFLNSKLFKFTFRDYFPELLGETLELRKVFFENVTIKPTIDETPYNELVNRILKNKEKGLPTKALELEIDTLLFDLYELTSIERSLILSSTGSDNAPAELIKLTSLAERE